MDTVVVSCYDCNNCGATIAPSYHDGGSCEQPVIYVDNDWVCSGCGRRITLSTTCFECGTETTPKKVEAPIDTGPRIDSADLEQRIHRGTNDRRRDEGIATLEYSDHLSAIALQHSRDMASREYFSHESPDGQGTVDRYRRFGHDDRSAGENISYREVSVGTSPAEIAEAIVDGWMDSRGHRENLLRDRFDQADVGVYLGTDGEIYTTQNFY